MEDHIFSKIHCIRIFLWNIASVPWGRAIPVFTKHLGHSFDAAAAAEC